MRTGRGERCRRDGPRDCRIAVFSVRWRACADGGLFERRGDELAAVVSTAGQIGYAAGDDELAAVVSIADQIEYEATVSVG